MEGNADVGYSGHCRRMGENSLGQHWYIPLIEYKLQTMLYEFWYYYIINCIVLIYVLIMYSRTKGKTIHCMDFDTIKKPFE